MATTFTDLTGNGSATKPFSFPSIKEADIKVEVDAVDYENRGITGASSGTTTFTITSYTTTGGGNVVFDSAPGSGALIRIYRDTDVDTPKATYTAGSSIKAGDLNNNQTQLLYAAQEEQNQTVITADIKNEAITTAKIKDQNVNTSKLANDAVTGAKIADDAINSEHYVDGSIDTAHIADAQITTAKIADDAVTNAKISPSAVSTTELTNSSVTANKLATDAVTTVKIQDTAVTTAKIADNNITTAKIADSNITTAKIADDAVTDAKIADGTLDGRYYTETELDAGQLDNRYFTETELSNGSLDSRYFTETELTNGALDGRYFTETEADARYFNISASETIKDGDTFPDNDTTIATTAAINDRIIDLVDDVGGFVPIANETSFPNAKPDVNNGTGTLVSIKALSQNLTSNGSGEISISNGTVGNSTVTITGAANSTTYAATFGMIVETTTTLNTYTFHRLVPKATEVSTVSGSISNVNTVAGAISNVNSVASNATNINTVAGINANVTTVAGISSDVTTVASNNSNVTAVAGNASNINSAVSNASNINSAVSNASNIKSAVSNVSNINSAVSNASNINTVAGSISNVNTAATNIASINTAASNITNVNNFADVYQVASSNPSTDGGGNAVAEGDLYFNTTANRLKVYDGANWVDGVSASSGGGVQTTGATFTGDVKLNDNVKLLVGTGNDLEVFHHATNGSFINDAGTSTIKLQTGGATKLEIQSGGVGITGDITVSGNVDGRDVAADGAKLDNIEASATADQTASEIVALVADQTIAPSEIDMEDNEKIKLGTGDDLEIYHDGSNSRIHDAGTGVLAISGSEVHIQNNNNSQSVAKFLGGTTNSSAELYYNDSKKFETTSTGVQVSGTCTLSSHLVLGDGDEIKVGTGEDLLIYHNGTNSIIDNNTGVLSIQGDDVRIQNSAGGETGLRFVADGAVELYHDSTKKFETTSAGVEITGSGTNAIEINATGTHELYSYHDSGGVGWATGTGGSYGELIYLNESNSSVALYASGEVGLNVIGNGAVELYYDNSKKFDTQSTGIKVYGDYFTNDANKINLGNSNDLQIHHDGTNSNIHNATGEFKIRSNDLRLMNAAGNEHYLVGSANGAVNLYYDNSLKVQTQSWGTSFTGNVSPSANSTHNLGSDAARWATIYGSAVNLNSDIRFASASWTGESCKIQQHSGALYIQGGSSTDYNIILRAGSAGTDRVYMADGGDFYPAGNNTQSLGRSSNQWGTIFGGTLDLGAPTVAAGDTNGVRITNPNGYVQLGPLNSSYAHFYTDRSRYYFDSPMEVNGNVNPYSTNTKTLGDFNHRWSTVHATNIEVYGSIQNVGVGKGIAILRERLSHDAETGSFSSGADRIRELNVHETQGITGFESFCTLDTTNHYFTLPAGVYYVEFTAGAFDTNNHRAKIITYNGTDVIFGNNARTGSGDSTSTYSIGSGYISTASTASYYLVHRAATTRSTKGFGLACDFASENEYYSQVIIYRIS